MVNHLRILLPIIVCLLLAQNCYAQIDTFQGLVDWYPIHGNSNNEVNISNGCSVHGAILTEDRFGRPNEAYHFDGNSYLLGNYNSIGFNGITFTAWIRTSLETRLQTIILFQSAYVAYINHFTAGRFMTAYDANSWNNPTDNESTSKVTNGKWTFIAASNDGSITRLYVNGKLEKSYPEILVRNRDQLGIGRKVVDDGSGFVGDIDDVRIYGRRLNDVEILETFNDTTIKVVPSPIIIPFVFGIYPNPTSGIFKIVLDSLPSNTHYNVFDVIGRGILEGEVKSKEISMNLTDYSSGLYFIRITFEDSSFVNKMVLNTNY